MRRALSPKPRPPPPPTSPQPNRAELYKTFLLYTMSADVVEMPAGGIIRKKTNPQVLAL